MPLSNATLPLRTLRYALLVPVLFCVGFPAAGQDFWEPQTSGTTAALHAVHFADPQVGFVVGADGTALRTTDGGENWVDVSPGIGADLNGVYVFDADLAVAVGEQGEIMRTTDGGASWKNIPSGVLDELHSVSFAGATGLAGGASQTIFRSLDEGLTWEIVQTGFFGGGFRGAHMLDDQTGFLGGDNSIFQPLVAFTSDGGDSFDFAFFLLNSNEGFLTDIHFLNDLEGLTTGITFDGRGAISRSQDGAATWSTTLFDTPLESINFAGEQVGYTVGAGGTLLKSEDGGLTWTAVDGGTSASLKGVSLPTSTVGYAVVLGGAILKGDLGTPTSTPDIDRAPGMRLEPVRPNPVRSETEARFVITESGRASLRVYDVLGREVARLVDSVYRPGVHTATLDASAWGAGTYVLVLESGGRRVGRLVTRVP